MQKDKQKKYNSEPSQHILGDHFAIQGHLAISKDIFHGYD